MYNLCASLLGSSCAQTYDCRCARQSLTSASEHKASCTAACCPTVLKTFYKHDEQKVSRARGVCGSLTLQAFHIDVLGPLAHARAAVMPRDARTSCVTLHAKLNAEGLVTYPLRRPPGKTPQLL